MFLISGHVRQGNIFSFGNVNVFPDLDVIALAFGTVMCLCTCGRLAPQSALLIPATTEDAVVLGVLEKQTHSFLSLPRQRMECAKLYLVIRQ